MKFKYCPFCANIRLERKGNEYFCSRCGWHGIPKEGDMTEINAAAKKYVPGTKWEEQPKQKIEQRKEDKKEILEKVKEKDLSDDVEFL